VGKFEFLILVVDHAVRRVVVSGALQPSVRDAESTASRGIGRERARAGFPTGAGNGSVDRGFGSMLQRLAGLHSVNVHTFTWGMSANPRKNDDLTTVVVFHRCGKSVDT